MSADGNLGNFEAVRFAVLGPLRAWYRGRELDLGSPQQRAVLVALLLAGGRQVTVGRLVKAVWGETPPAAAVSTVRTYVSRLRAILEPDRVSGEPARLVLAVPGGYLLQTAGNTLDVSELEARVSEARGLGEAGRLSEAAEVLDAALGAWQGTPLTGVPGPLAESERLRLTERRMSVLEARFDVDLKLGRHADVVSELTALCAEHPLREQLRALQMLALYRCGRQAEALVVFQEVRRLLVSERGLEPGAELRDLHARLLAADPLLAAKEQESVQAESPAVASTVPRQLPADLPGFTGRWEELARIQAMVPAADEPPAVVAVSGMAGVGKTALALRLAHTVVDRFPDGQLHLDLGGFGPAATVVEPEVAVRTFLGALGVFPAQIPEGLDAQVALYRSVLTRRRLLIVLDNATGSDHVRPLLPSTPGCLVVVTSRHQLSGLVASHNARPVTLDVLTEPDAGAFLVERLGAARTSAEPRATHDIVRACAGLPLALAIVAARAATNPAFPLSGIAAELHDAKGSLDAFAGSDHAMDARAAFSWSYQVLTPETAKLFRLLALHPGPGISVQAAAVLAGTAPRETRSLLTALTHAHLVVEFPPRRYTVHALLRDYARELTEETDLAVERHAALSRLFDHYLHSANSAAAWLSPGSPRPSLAPPVSGSVPRTFEDYESARAWFDAERTVLLAMLEVAAEGFERRSWELAPALIDLLRRREDQAGAVETSTVDNIGYLDHRRSDVG